MMNKKLILYEFCFLLILFLPKVYSVDSELKADYYFNGTYRITDNIESSGELGLDGTAAVNGQNVGTTGWGTTDLLCTYSNAQASKGTLSIYCEGTAANQQEAYIDLPDNASFTGSLGFKMRPVSGKDYVYGLQVGASASPSNNLMFLYVKSDVSGTQFACYDTASYGVCDGGQSIHFDSWNNTFYLNWTGSGVKALIYDGIGSWQVLHTWGSYTGITQVKFIAATTDAQMYIDDFWMASGDRPQSAPTDSTPPLANSSLNNTTPKINDVINFSANVSDETGLSGCQFINNQSNLTYQNVTVSGTDDKCHQNFTIGLSRGNVINFTLIVNDSFDNKNQTDYLITVANTNPTTPTFLNTSYQEYTKNQTFNVSGTDADGDNLLFSWFQNTSTTGLVLLQSGDNLYSWTTNWTQNTSYFFIVNISDYTSSNISSNVFNANLNITGRYYANYSNFTHEEGAYLDVSSIGSAYTPITDETEIKKGKMYLAFPKYFIKGKKSNVSLIIYDCNDNRLDDDISVSYNDKTFILEKANKIDIGRYILTFHTYSNAISGMYRFDIQTFKEPVISQNFTINVSDSYVKNQIIENINSLYNSIISPMQKSSLVSEKEKISNDNWAKYAIIVIGGLVTLFTLTVFIKVIKQK